MFEACQACNKEIEVENEAGKRNNLDLNILTENINTLQEHIDQKLHSTTSSGLKDCLNIECQHRSVKQLITKYINMPDYLMVRIGRGDEGGRKITHPIQINENLNIQGTEYKSIMSVVHRGPSTQSGHYFCLQNYGSKTIQFNDEEVDVIEKNFEDTNTQLECNNQDTFDTPVMILCKKRQIIELENPVIDLTEFDQAKQNFILSLCQPQLTIQQREQNRGDKQKVKKKKKQRYQVINRPQRSRRQNTDYGHQKEDQKMAEELALNEQEVMLKKFNEIMMEENMRLMTPELAGYAQQITDKFKSYITQSCLDCQRAVIHPFMENDPEKQKRILENKQKNKNYIFEQCKKCKKRVKDKEKLPFSEDEEGCLNPKRTHFKPIPKCLKVLTAIERLLISRIAPVMKYFKTKVYQHKYYSGHCINMKQDICKLINVIPRKVEDHQFIIKITKSGKDREAKFLKVCHIRIREAIIWLQENNLAYNDVKIDEEEMKKLEKVEYYYELEGANVQYIDDNEIEEDTNENPNLTKEDLEKQKSKNTGDEELMPEQITNTFLDQKEAKHNSEEFQANAGNTEKDVIFDLAHGEEKINEYVTKNMCTLAYPCEFPWGETSVFDDIPGLTTKEQPSIMEKIQRLIQFREYELDEFDRPRNRFMENPTIIYWLWNRYQREETKKQTRLILKGIDQDSKSMTTEEALALRAENPEKFENMLKTTMRKFTGSKEYWNKHLKQLQQAITQKGTPTFFMTVSCADLANKVIQDLVYGDLDDVYKNTSNNTHVIDELFTKMLNDVIDGWIRKQFPVKYHFIRYEYQNRGTIHAHILIKLKNEPSMHWKFNNEKNKIHYRGLISLGNIAIKGHQAQIQIDRRQERGGIMNYQEESQYSEYQEWVEAGIEAEKLICKYNDDLGIVANKFKSCQSADPSLTKKTLYSGMNIADHANLVGTVQYHKCSALTCLKKSKKCRAQFAKKEMESTSVIFEDIEDTETKEIITKAQVEPIRNKDSLYTNQYNIVLIMTMRCNVDMRLVICQKSLLKYLLKYVSKAEVKSLSLTEVVKNFSNENVDEPIELPTSSRTYIQKILNKYMGQRDYSQMEMVRTILHGELVDTSLSFKYLNLDYESDITTFYKNIYSKKQEDQDTVVHLRKSPIEIYEMREQLYKEKNKEASELDLEFLKNTSLFDFYQKYTVSHYQKTDQYTLTQHTETTQQNQVLTIYPQYKSTASNTKNYPKYCKYSLIKFKPFESQTQELWDGKDKLEDEQYVKKWVEFIKSQKDSENVDESLKSHLLNEEAFDEFQKCDPEDIEDIFAMYEEDEDNIHLVQYMGALEGMEQFGDEDDDDEEENVLKKVTQHYEAQNTDKLKQQAQNISQIYKEQQAEFENIVKSYDTKKGKVDLKVVDLKTLNHQQN